MGLAPYGIPRYADLIREKIVSIFEDGSLRLDMSYFNYCQGLTMTSERFHELFGGPPRQPESFITQKEMDLAASIQVVCEEVVLRAGRYAHACDRRVESGHGRWRGAELCGQRTAAPRGAVREHLDSAGGGRCRRARSGRRCWCGITCSGSRARCSRPTLRKGRCLGRRSITTTFACSSTPSAPNTSSCMTKTPCSIGWRGC